MNIAKSKNGTVELKTKKATIVFNDHVAINDVNLEGAGEYEIGEISVQGIEDYLYVINAEDLTIGLLDFKCKISKEQIDTLSNADILIIRIDGDVKGAVEQVNQIEPKTAIYLGNEASFVSLEENGISIENVGQVKLTKNDSELEGKSYFIEIQSGENVSGS